MAREFICLYFSWLETGATLTDEEFGRMCRAGLQYGLDGTEPDLPGNDKILFPVMKWQVDRDVSKFDEICQKRREAGSRGGKSKSKQSEANQANATFALQMQRPSRDYIVITEASNVKGNLGQIEVSDQLSNGFKVAYTGSATAATINYIVIGGYMK